MVLMTIVFLSMRIPLIIFCLLFSLSLSSPSFLLLLLYCLLCLLFLATKFQFPNFFINFQVYRFLLKAIPSDGHYKIHSLCTMLYFFLSFSPLLCPFVPPPFILSLPLSILSTPSVFRSLSLSLSAA